MRGTRSIIVELLAVVIISLSGKHIYAESVKCTVTAIQASNDGQGLDPEISDIDELKKPPLSKIYSRFKLIQKYDTTIDKGQEKSHTIPDKKIVTIRYIGESKNMLEIRLKTVNPKIETDVKMKNGGYFFTVTDSGFILMVGCSK